MNMPSRWDSKSTVRGEILAFTNQNFRAMRKTTLLITAFILSLGVIAQDNAQARGGQSFSSFNDFNPKKDFYCGWDKAIKKSASAGLLSGSLHFKDITSGSVLLGKGQRRESVVAWAVLEGITDQTRQEIADEFAGMFKKKMESAGIASISEENLKNSKSYPKLVEGANKTEDSGKLIGSVKIKSADQAPYNRYNPLKTPGLYSKIAKDAAADVYTYDIVIDFARFDIQASRWKSDGYGPGYDFINTKTSSDVMPQISIKSTNSADRLKLVTSNLTLINEKKMNSTINLSKNLFYNENYATEIDSYKGEMPEAINKGLSINTRTTGTFVIKADEKKYKQVVLKALDAYSDLLIEYMTSELR